jgi:predicted RNA-binding protein
VKNLGKYREFLEENSPVTHSRGLFYLDSTGLARPEIVRHQSKLVNWPSVGGKIMILLPEPRSKPFHRSKEMKGVRTVLRRSLNSRFEDLVFCIFAYPFGVTPLELDETYPLSQYEASSPADEDTKRYVAGEVSRFLMSQGRCYQAMVVYAAGEVGQVIARKIEEDPLDSRVLVIKNEGQVWNHKALEALAEKVAEVF